MTEWMKSIVAFMIFSPLISLVIPNEHYKKYISYYLAILFLLVLLQPIGKILDVDGWWQWLEQFF
jgi:hypothetical protein